MSLPGIVVENSVSKEVKRRKANNFKIFVIAMLNNLKNLWPYELHKGTNF